MINKVASGAIIAFNNLKDARIGIRSGKVNGISVNRRDPRNGPIDPEVPIIRFEDHNGNVIVNLYSFTAHAVVMGSTNLYISADYPEASNEFIERNLGGGVIFLQGACGDINPLVPDTDISKVYDRDRGTFREVKRMGTILGSEVVKNSQLIYSTSDVRDVKAISHKVKLGVNIPVDRNIAVRRYRDARKMLNKKISINEKKKSALDLMMNYRYIRVYDRLINGNYIETVIQGLRIGDLYLITIPGEALVRYSLNIKNKVKRAIVNAYSNDYIGYIPTSLEFKEGGYEAKPPWCILAEEGIKRIEEELMKVIELLS